MYVCVPCPCGGQKRALGSLEFELKVVVRCWELNLLCNSSK